MKKAGYITFMLFCFIWFGSAAQSLEIQKTSLTYKDSLQLDFYHTEESNKHPNLLLVLMHGGGFASGKKDGKDESEFCRDMASRGYAVASISYRLTRKNDPFNCDCDTEKKIGSFVSASEDLSDAIHFLKAEKELIFDRNKIVLAGSSAGAETVLHYAFMNHDYRFSHISPTKISGMISFAGAIANASYITKNNTVPSLFIHGKKDELVPFGTAPHHYCTEDKKGYLLLDGPATMVKKLKAHGGSYMLAFDPEGKHDWANKAYFQTELVARFLKELVEDKKFVQASIELDHVSSEEESVIEHP